MTADYPEAKIFREIKEMAKLLSEKYNYGPHEVIPFVLNTERLIMSDDHSLNEVFKVLIEDPAFRTAMVAGICTIIPEAFVDNVSNEMLAMLITYTVACTIAATED